MEQDELKVFGLTNLLAAVARAELEARDIDAETLLRDAMERYPADERAYLKLAWLKRRQANSAEMRSLLSKVFYGNFEMQHQGLRGGSFDIFCDDIFSIKGNAEAIAEVENLCRRELLQVGECSWARLYLGAVAFAAGREPEFFEEFNACLSLGDSRQGNTFGSSTFKDDAYIETLDNNAGNCGQIIKLDLSRAPIADIEVVYAVACDGFYFGKFGENIITSLKGKLERAVCHIHILNAENPYAFDNHNYGERVIITNSSYAFDESITKLDKKALYTCIRFFLMTKLLQLYSKPTIVSEFDAEVVMPLIDYVKLHQGRFDVGLSFIHNGNFFPWTSVWAGQVMCHPTENGVRFAELVDSYCRSFFPNSGWSKNLWHVDQNALYCVYRYMSKHVRGAEFRDLRQGVPSLVRHHGGIY